MTANTNYCQFHVQFLIFIFALLILGKASAQPAKNAGKFLGNITTMGQVRTDFTDYWNCIAGENECQWLSIEQQRNKMVWTGADRIAAYAREKNIPWRFHSLFTSGNYPAWMANLPDTALLREIGEWMDSAAARYPDVTMVDVFNESNAYNLPAIFKTALGGNGVTGFDWAIKAFTMARQRWPHALLCYNDYNNIEYESSITWTIDLVTALQQANAPIDIIGCEANFVTKIATATVKANIDRIAGLGLPVHISAFEVGSNNDSTQAGIMREKFTMFWNHPKVIGVTYWGYVVGQTWRDGTGLLTREGVERPALIWLKDFVKNNPDPPNDFPDLFDPPTTAKYSAMHAPVRANTFLEIGANACAVFDLQGRCVGRFDQRISSNRHTMASTLYVVRFTGATGYPVFFSGTLRLK
jgi:endo-1,4-beta-xylanase